MIEKSIAVLPFRDLSSAPENAHFAAGVQDAILTDLAKIADLKVINRTSVRHYSADAPRNLREISEQLQVGYLLEGSVQRVGDRRAGDREVNRNANEYAALGGALRQGPGGCFRDPKRDCKSHRAAIARPAFADGTDRGAESRHA